MNYEDLSREELIDALKRLEKSHMELVSSLQESPTEKYKYIIKTRELEKNTQQLALQNFFDLEGIYQNAQVGLCVLDEKMRFMRVNDFFTCANGLSAEEHIGRTPKEILPGGLGDTIEKSLQEVLASGEPRITLEAYGEMPSRPGKLGCCEEFLTPIKDADGHIIGVSVALVDITEHKDLEDQLKEAARQAEYRADELDAVFNAISDGIIIYDTQGNVVAINEGAKAQFELYNDPEYLSFGFKKRFKRAQFFNLNDERLGLEDFPVYRALQNGEAIRDFLLIQKQNKQKIYLSINAAPIKNAEGETTGAVVLIRNVTEQKMAELEAEESKENALKLVEKLRRADENKNVFFNMLSHELRNPLASIKMSLLLLDQDTPGPDKEKRAKEIAKRQLAHLTGMVDELLDVARISQQKIVLKKEPINLAELIPRIVEDYRMQFADKGVELITEIYVDSLDLEADPQRLRQAIENLLGNAYKFTKKGDRTAITLTRDERTKEAVIVVCDTGIGIKPKFLDSIFESFIQIEDSLDRSNGGLGLGLAVVKGMVELHGGSVGVYSEGIGKGAQFTIRLPLPQIKEIAERSSAMEKKEPARTLHVLMIEDNADFAQVMCDLISLSGYQTSVALSGPDGIAMAKESHPDVIICDIGLPGMNGYEVARMVRNDMNLMDIFLIALSGYTSDKDLEQAREAGFDRHLAKPVDIVAIEKIFSEIIEHKAVG